MNDRLQIKWPRLPGLAALAAITLVSIVLAPVWPGQDVVRGLALPAASPSGGPYFVENVGQFDPGARYLFLNGPGGTWLAGDGLWISVLEADKPTAEDAEELLQGVHLKLAFGGADAAVYPRGEAQQDVHVSYFLGADPEGWREDVPVWGQVRYRSLYPGIDLVLGGGVASDILPWHLEVDGGADLAAVRLQVWGAEGVEVREGSLHLTTAVGAVSVPLPQVVAAGGEILTRAGAPLPTPSVEAGVSGAFEVAFPFVPDVETTTSVPAEGPEDLSYSTFLGGSSWDWGYGIDVDGSGAAYVSGSTPSADFPTVPGSFDTTLDAQDVFAVKLQPGVGLAYATFVGGTGYESGRGVSVAGGNAYLTGRTNSPDFPTTTGAFDTTCGTDGLCDLEHYDTFLVKLNAIGTSLEYATFLGGEDNEIGVGISAEGGRAYVTGQTESTAFPTTAGAFDRTCGSDGKCSPSGGIRTTDAFLIKINPAGQGAADLEYGTYLGGSFDDDGSGVAVDGGIAFLTGESESFDFPAPGYQGGGDAFVVKLNPAGSGSGDLLYGTFLGGSSHDSGEALAVRDGLVTVAGETRSSNFPATWGSFGGGVNDAFVARLDAGGAVDFAAYVGGSGQDQARGVALNALGHAILTGQSRSADFPTTPDSYDPDYNGGKDVILVRINPDEAEPIEYATYLGGSGDDDGEAVAVDIWGFAYATGYTTSSDYPTTAGSFQTTYGGGASDSFVSKVRVGSGPALALTKRTNGEPADEPPGPYVLAGDPIVWTYAVTNTGEVDLSDVAVVDDQGIIVDCPSTALAIGASMTCDASGTAIAGQYANTATATASPPPGFGAPVAEDTSHYFGVVPGITLEKHTNDQDADAPPGVYILLGDPVTWTYTVTNTGNALLSGITVTDDQGVSVDCSEDSLLAGHSMSCTATSTAALGQYENVGTATGSPPGGLAPVSDSDPSHYYGADPAVSLEKHTNGQDADAAPGPSILVGDLVNWSYMVANLGNVPLSGVSVVDDGGVEVECPETELAEGGSTVCTASGIAERGQYTNTATVEATPPVGSEVSAQDMSHYFGVVPQVTMQKRTNGEDADSAPGPFVETGGPVIWTYVVTNTGNVPLTAIEVSDDQGVAVDCPGSSLAVDESMTCTAEGVAVSGQYGNVGTIAATASPEGMEPVEVTASDPSHYYGSDPSLAIQKLTNGQDADAAPGVYLLVGDAVAWTYVVTNTGNVALTDVEVSDDQPEVTVDCPKTGLAVDESMTCTATGEAVAGQYLNTGMVTGKPPVGENANAEDPSHYFGVEAGISLEKRTNEVDADEAPGPIIQAGTLLTWTYVVANTGNVALTGLDVTDDQGVEIECAANELAVEASTVCTATGLAIVGQYTNTGTVVGNPPGGLPAVSDTDTSHYFGGDPAIDVEKYTNGQDADGPTGPTILVDSEVLWEYTVENVGNLPLSAIVIADSDPDVVVACPASELAVGESMLCTAEGTATTGQYSNTAEATGAPSGGLDEVSDTDPSHYFGINPSIDLEKHTNGVDADEMTGPYVVVDDTVTWTYHLTNTGDILLLDVAVTDDQLGDITCPRTSLGEGDSMTCTVTGDALPGQQGNEGQVSAVPLGASVVVTDTDRSHYFGASLALTIEKWTNGQDADEPTGPLVLEGGAVSWTYLINNSSNVTLTEVVVSDDVLGTITCPQEALLAGEGMTCVETGAAESGQYANLGTVTATPPGGLEGISGSDPSHYYGVSPSLALAKRTNGQDADEPPGPYIWESTPVTWTYSITNTGNITLNGLALVDDQLGEVDCPSSTLAADESMTCQATGVAELGQYANTAEVTGSPPLGPQVAADDDSHYFGISPSIEINKYTNGWDADTEPWPSIYAGEVVTWTYVVTNTGDITLSDIAVTDDQLGSVDCPTLTLGPAMTMTCEVTGTAVSGTYANVGTVVGKPPGGPDVSASDPSHYLGRKAEPAIDIEKFTNGLDADTAPGPYIPVGEGVTWTYVVNNTGNVEVTSIAVTDSDLGEITCPQDYLGELESMECVATGSAVAGQYDNVATVTGTADPGGLEPVEVSDSDPSHYFGSDPAIGLTKLTNGQDADEEPGIYILAGEAVTWTYRVTNTGNVDLSGVSVNDDQGEEVSCPYSVLAAGAAMTCTATGTAAPGQYANLATAQGTPLVGLLVDASDADYYFGAILAASFEKRTDGQDADGAPGPLIPVDEAVTWTYHITNTSNVPLSLDVSDSEGVPVTCEDSSVPPTGTVICSGQGTATAGQYANTGTATLTPPGELAPLVLGDDSHYFGSQPRVELEKLTNGADADEAPGPFVPVGEAVEWTYHVANTGNITLTQLLVTDDQGLDVECPLDALAPDEAMVCSATGTASVGQYVNVATVTGRPLVGPEVEDSDPSHYFGTLPGIDLEKHTNGEDADVPPGPSLLAGQPVSWTYHVTNTGNIALSSVEVTDDQGLAVDCPQATLEPGEVMTCTASAAATAGQYINVGLARGTPPAGAVVSDSDPSHYSAIVAEPAIGIQKLTNGVDADQAPGPYIMAGDPVEWVYLVTNAGNVTLNDITVVDDRIGVVGCPQNSLDAGEWMECREDGTAEPDQYSNRGTVTGTPPIGSDVTAYDDSHYFGMVPGIMLAKRTNGLDADEAPGPYIVVGEPIEWTYVVTNSGNITLTQVTVADDQEIEVSCPVEVLGAGESMTCTAEGTAAVGQYGNVGVVEGQPPEGDAVLATDASHYFGISPGILIQKYTNDVDADVSPGPLVLEGLSIEWTYVVSNTGDVELADVTVVDDQGVEPDCPQTKLSVGEVMTCTASGQSVVGQYANIGTAVGTHPGGGVVEATDPSHYLGIAIRPVVDVQKRTNGFDADLPPGPFIPVGDSVEWEYLVTNSGNVTLVELTVVDDQGVTIACPGDTLESVESMVCTGSGIAVAGQYSNVATATGVVLRTGEVISDTDPSHYFGSIPGITLEKLTNGFDADEAPGPRISAGETVVWSYRVSNTGNVPLTGVVVTDDQGVSVSCPNTTLGAGATMTCTATGVAQVGPYVNVGSVVGAFGGEVVVDLDPSHYYGSYTIYLPLIVR